MTWWCFDREKLRQALCEYRDQVLAPQAGAEQAAAEAALIEEFLYSESMQRHDNCRLDNGERDFTVSSGEARVVSGSEER